MRSSRAPISRMNATIFPTLHTWDFPIALNSSIARISASPVGGRYVTDRAVMCPSAATRVTRPHAQYFSANLVLTSERARRA
jgi:hypothetical protein